MRLAVHDDQRVTKLVEGASFRAVEQVLVRREEGRVGQHFSSMRRETK
jgi:hypothetical protein